MVVRELLHRLGGSCEHHQVMSTFLCKIIFKVEGLECERALHASAGRMLSSWYQWLSQ